MAQQPRSAAQSLYPHLASGERPERQPPAQSLGDAMWPSLSSAAKRAEAAQSRWQRQYEQRRQNLLAALREARGRG
jgi:hypothetical protein